MAFEKTPVEGVAPSGPPTTEPNEVPRIENDVDADDQDTRLKATDRVIQGAKTATEKEQKMTLLQGIRLYPKAIAWSILISTCIVMEGYDVCLINNFCESAPFSSLLGRGSTDWNDPQRRISPVQQKVWRATPGSERRTYWQVGGARPMASRVEQCKSWYGPVRAALQSPRWDETATNELTGGPESGC